MQEKLFHTHLEHFRNMINYSFIIPHHNSPDLLNRCLDSIPQRDDIEIIVVDDNSDNDKLPRIDRRDVKLISIDAANTKGAGRARNYGLKEAHGKWILFADCDDYYTNSFLEYLDKYTNENVDVYYFNVDCSDVLKNWYDPLLCYYPTLIENYNGDKEQKNLLKFRYNQPWNKMISKQFLDKYMFRFEEVPKGNDVLFTFQIGYFLRKMEVIPEFIYVYTFNSKSITNNKRTKDDYLLYIASTFKINSFYDFIQKPEWKTKPTIWLMRCLKNEKISTTISLFKEYIKMLRRGIIFRNDYVNTIKIHEEKSFLT